MDLASLVQSTGHSQPVRNQDAWTRASVHSSAIREGASKPGRACGAAFAMLVAPQAASAMA